MTWSQLYYLFGSLAAVVTIFGFFKGPLKNAATWVFQNGAKVIFTAASIAAVSLIVFSSRYYYLSSCTGEAKAEAKAKECIEKNAYRNGIYGIVPCIRKLVVSGQLSAKRGREIVRQWDKAKAEFEGKSIIDKKYPCIQENESRNYTSFCLRELVARGKLSIKRGRELMQLWDKRKAKARKLRAEFEKKGD